MVLHASLFSRLTVMFNRNRFYKLVYRHQAGRYVKGFSCRDQSDLVAPTSRLNIRRNSPSFSGIAVSLPALNTRLHNPAVRRSIRLSVSREAAHHREPGQPRPGHVIYQFERILQVRFDGNHRHYRSIIRCGGHRRFLSEIPGKQQDFHVFVSPGNHRQFHQRAVRRLIGPADEVEIR